MTTNPQTNTNDSTTIVAKLSLDRVYRLAKPVRDVLLFSSVYLALIAVAEVLIVTELLSLPLTPAPLVAGLLTFAVYGNDRVADVETDEQTTPARAAFIKRYHRLLYSLSAVAYGLAVALAVVGGPAAFGLALVPGVVWLCYAQDWLPGAGHIQRLKQVFIVNSALVAVAWALVITFLPVAFAGAPVTPATGVVFLFLVLATFVDVEIPNVRDRTGDRELGVKTLPVVFGVEGTRYALYGVMAFTAAILVAAFHQGILSLASVGGLSLTLVVLLGVVARLGRSDRMRTLTVAAECSRLPVLVVVVIPVL